MMRTKEQIGFVTVSDAPILRVVEDSSSPTDSGDPDLWFGYDDGEIHVKIPPRWSGDADSWRGAVAHEVGHAIGLNHLPPDALMSIGGTLPLNSSDLSALAHVRHRD
jgi:hypothetical protein